MKINKLYKSDYPYLLKMISKLPESMDIIGKMPPETYKYLCVVGSRTFSSYGKEVCEKLITGLSGYPIVIVSGLANGIDTIAHETALSVGLKTIAFPGSGLAENIIHPRCNIGLARRIVDSGGVLISPFPPNQNGSHWTFPVRNRLMAGISHATLIIEARQGSGTLLTANDANNIGRTVLAVPGSIFSHLTHGTHSLIRDGATAVTCSEDILEALGFNKDKSMSTIGNDNKSTQTLFGTELSDNEKLILEKIATPISRDELIRQLDLPAGYINSILIELELKNQIKERQGLLVIN